jgi:murein peptide amidase A
MGFRKRTRTPSHFGLIKQLIPMKTSQARETVPNLQNVLKIEPFRMDSSRAMEMIRAAAAAGWVVHTLPTRRDQSQPWFERSVGPAPGARPPRLYVSAGIHGDEPAGVLAAAELLRQPEVFAGLEVVVFPILNPTGLAAGTRTNAEGIDLNRDYREPRAEESAAHRSVLESLRPFDAYVLLHEDWEATGAYLYELTLTGASQAPALLECLARHVPIELATEIDGFPAHRGIIRRESLPDRPDWPEALYLAHHLCRHGYTLETPSAAPLAHRVCAHVDAVACLAAALRRNPLDFSGRLAEADRLGPPP